MTAEVATGHSAGRYGDFRGVSDWIIDGLKVCAKIMVFGILFLAAFWGMASCTVKMDKQGCIEKGKALGAEVKFYNDRCYVKGYSDGR